MLGLRIWAATRMVEVAFKRFMTLLSGTWAMNVYLRALGATIGDWATFRLGMCLPLCPDQITIQDGCTPLPLHCFFSSADKGIPGRAVKIPECAC